MTSETRMSLLLRVRDHCDTSAWEEFVAIYSPVIFRMARFRGLQPADADDIVQTVLVSIAKAIEQRPHDPQRAKFRTWLSRVAENAILNAITRRKPDAAHGGSEALELLRQHQGSVEDSQLLVRERREEIFRHAASQIRSEFADATWQAFWLTTVDGRSCDEVAAELGRNVGSVYAARSRVMKRLHEKVQQYEF